VYMSKVVNVNVGQAALGYAAFSLMMVVGRLSGDWLASRVPPARLVRLGGVIACVGLLTTIVYPHMISSLIGFAAVGAGLSIVVPLAFSAAGNVPGLSSGTGIAGVATLGFTGFLIGPPTIGFIAEASSLRVGLFLAAVLIGILALNGGALNLARSPVAKPQTPHV
jgi:MFS family permease